MSTPIIITIGSPGVPGGISVPGDPKTQEFKIVPGTTPGTTDGMMSYTNPLFANKRLDVYLDGVLLYPGLIDRQSYTWNNTTATLTFVNPIYASQTLIIHAE